MLLHKGPLGLTGSQDVLDVADAGGLFIDALLRDISKRNVTSVIGMSEMCTDTLRHMILLDAFAVGLPPYK